MQRLYGPFSGLLPRSHSLPLPELVRLVVTRISASLFGDPEMLAKEAEAAFGSPVEVARDLVAFGF